VDTKQGGVARTISSFEHLIGFFYWLKSSLKIVIGLIIIHSDSVLCVWGILRVETVSFHLGQRLPFEDLPLPH
jgi:hypothetical protein